MAATALDSFCDLIRKSNLVEAPRLTEYLQKLHATEGLPEEPKALADLMVRDALLSQFQADQLVAGKWRGFIVGKYRVLEKIGTGGMGQVYLAEHKLMRNRVALKVLPRSKAAEPAALARFYREAKAGGALNHPNIVRVFDIDQDGDLHYLVMEFVDGVSFHDLTRMRGPLDPELTAHYIYQAASGLEHAHQTGLIHRDLKPSNLLVDRQGTVKILDMGLARFFHDDQDMITRKYDENVLGTADYLSPEQAVDSHTVDIRSDIYSLGCTFYFMLAGQPPFGEGSVAQKLIWHQTRKPRSILEHRPDMPLDITAVLEKMMARAIVDRFQTPGELMHSLEKYGQMVFPPPSDAELPNLSPLARKGLTSEPTMTVAQSGSSYGSSPPLRSSDPGSRSAEATGTSPNLSSDARDTQRDFRAVASSRPDAPNGLVPPPRQAPPTPPPATPTRKRNTGLAPGSVPAAPTASQPAAYATTPPEGIRTGAAAPKSPARGYAPPPRPAPAPIPPPAAPTPAAWTQQPTAVPQETVAPAPDLRKQKLLLIGISISLIFLMVLIFVLLLVFGGR
jgi:serine/threonine protein kinase